jgi:hypothetical protein
MSRCVECNLLDRHYGWCSHYVHPNGVAGLQAQIAVLKQGLMDVVNPMGKLEREMPEGCEVSGMGAVMYLHDYHTYIDIAKEALQKHKELG